MGRYAKTSNEVIDEINRLYRLGLTMQEVANKLNISHGAVNRYVSKSRPRGPYEVVKRKERKEIRKGLAG